MGKLISSFKISKEFSYVSRSKIYFPLVLMLILGKVRLSGGLNCHTRFGLMRTVKMFAKQTRESSYQIHIQTNLTKSRESTLFKSATGITMHGLERKILTCHTSHLLRLERWTDSSIQQIIPYQVRGRKNLTLFTFKHF